MAYTAGMMGGLTERWLVKVGALALAVFVAMPCGAVNWPLSSEAIREAYFLGTRQTGVPGMFLPQYTRAIPELKAGYCVSRVRIETPFFQVAYRASKANNYSAQDAEQEFSGKPAVVRMYLEICYRNDAPPPSAGRSASCRRVC